MPCKAMARKQVYFGVPLIFPKSAVNLALFVRALSPKRIDARFARNYLLVLNPSECKASSIHTLARDDTWPSRTQKRTCKHNLIA